MTATAIIIVSAIIGGLIGTCLGYIMFKNK